MEADESVYRQQFQATTIIMDGGVDEADDESGRVYYNEYAIPAKEIQEIDDSTLEPTREY